MTESEFVDFVLDVIRRYEAGEFGSDRPGNGDEAFQEIRARDVAVRRPEEDRP